MLSRIQQIIKSKNLTPSKFAEEIGVQRSAMSHILSGRNNPSLEFVQKVLSHFPDTRTDWLLTGNGQMYKEFNLFEPLVPTSQESVKTELKESEPKESNVETLQATSLPNEPKNPILTDKSSRDVARNVSTPTPFPHSINKSIDKIVIFYSDKSFSEYKPEK